MERLASSSSLFSSPAQTRSIADPALGRSYDVFLNHRGPDVKQSLASIIYHWLQDKGFRVFLDKEEFQAGEGLHPTIQQAIRSASVHVAIFSKGYAESSWCLDELCSMLKSGAKIIPVFYDVRPSDLRWVGEGKGVYEGAFSKHEMKGRVDLQKLDEWKAALQQISNRHGLELDGSEFKGDQGKLLKRLVDTVSEAVAEKVPLESAKHPVGLDEAVEDFHDFIQRKAQVRKEESVKIVGIVGFGGSGKTTLAKQFYNIKRTTFTASSFLSEVRHAAAQHKLQNLQWQLLKDLLRITDNTIEISSVSGGREILKNRLRSLAPRVLVVLDDIDHEDQVDNLLVKEVLGSGSLVLLTSRDEIALLKSGADRPFKIKPLKSNHALQLFSRHAFQQPLPKRGFEDLAEKFCKRCGGFPLFLKVMGAHLHFTAGEDEAAWRDELEYIPEDIKNLLNVSYNALSREEKQMFLDIACFFIGVNKATAIRMWNASDTRVSTRLKNLQRKCLVEVDDENCLEMHDHLRDFGREIAEHESPCRFWQPHHIINTQEQSQGKREVRGIIAANGKYYPDMRLDKTFKEIDLPKLKFLVIEHDCFANGRKRQKTNLMWLQRTINLTWLRWSGCPHTDISSRWISMKNLTVLQLSGRLLERWEVYDTQLPLKELVIQYTRLSYVSIDEETCPQLEHLDLSRNQWLAEVGRLPATLVFLDLSLCTRLKKIPASFHVKNLKLLNIDECGELRDLPDLKRLTSLETLQAQNCLMLQNIQGVDHLSKLKELNVGGCSQLWELPNLSGLTSLKMLTARGCSKLQNIPGLEHLSKLKELNVGGCFELCELPNLSGLTSLKMLTAWDCSKLQNIRSLDYLSKLKELNVGGCSQLCELPNLSGLTSLETLLAWGCSKLQNIQGLEHLSKLRHLNVGGCSELKELPNLAGLTSLETLGALGCNNLQNIQGLERLSKFRHLDVRECSKLDELPKL